MCSPEAPKKTYDHHDNDSTVTETPFIRIRQLHPGGTSKDCHDALVSHPKYHMLAISKINAPVILISHSSLDDGLAHPSVRNYGVIHLRLCLILPLPVLCTIYGI